MDPLEGAGLVGELRGHPVGLVTWVVGGAFSGPHEAEIRVLVVTETARNRGAGGALIAAAERALAAAGVELAWLVTTNDNLDALRFYQRRGWRLRALRPGAIVEARRRLKPSIGTVGAHGIRLRDELELELDLGAAPTPGPRAASASIPEPLG